MSSKKVVSYLRCSSLAQNLDSQREAINNYCLIHSLDISKTYMDEGFTGARFDNRSGFKQLLTDARSRRFNTLIVYKIDRIGRSLVEMVSFLKELQDLKITFISITDNIDMSNAQGVLFASLLCSFASYERNLIVERTNAGIAAARARGKILGRKRKRNDKMILELKEGGLSYNAIAKQLQLAPSTVSRALKPLLQKGVVNAGTKT
jgi:DNA invertase Pin-like site-specific DNA recombinase